MRRGHAPLSGVLYGRGGAVSFPVRAAPGRLRSWTALHHDPDRHEAHGGRLPHLWSLLRSGPQPLHAYALGPALTRYSGTALPLDASRPPASGEPSPSGCRKRCCPTGVQDATPFERPPTPRPLPGRGGGCSTGPSAGHSHQPGHAAASGQTAARPGLALPRCLGVDDWAWQEGQRYGTPLCAVEDGRIVASCLSGVPTHSPHG